MLFSEKIPVKNSGTAVPDKYQLCHIHNSCFNLERNARLRMDQRPVRSHTPSPSILKCDQVK